MQVPNSLKKLRILFTQTHTEDLLSLLHRASVFDGDTKVTDMLYGCYDLAEAGKDFDGALADIKARYDEIIEGLGLDLTLDKEFETIHEQFRLKAGRNSCRIQR